MPNKQWRQHAKCVKDKKSVSDFFPEERNKISSPVYAAELQALRDYCADCPVRRLCLEDAFEHEYSITNGIYAGTTPEQRSAIAEERNLQFPRRRITSD